MNLCKFTISYVSLLLQQIFTAQTYKYDIRLYICPNIVTILL